MHSDFLLIYSFSYALFAVKVISGQITLVFQATKSSNFTSTTNGSAIGGSDASQRFLLTGPISSEYCEDFQFTDSLWPKFAAQRIVLFSEKKILEPFRNLERLHLSSHNLSIPVGPHHFNSRSLQTCHLQHLRQP